MPDESQSRVCDSQAGGLPGNNLEGDGHWLAGYTRSHYEHKVRNFYQQRGWEVFLPTYRSWRRWSDRRKLLDLPLFPSYVFVRLREADRYRAVQAPGFLWFVTQDHRPAIVNGQELQAIRQALASGLQYDPMPTLHLGDEVEIIDGPMRGAHGRLIRKEKNAVALLVSAINGGVRITFPDASWIRALKKTHAITSPGLRWQPTSSQV